MLNREPYVSVVVTARNDDHGGNLLGRMQAFVNAWLGLAKRHGLASELIVVDWNPPQDRPPLIEALRWPADTGPCEVRFIQVPPEIHRTYRHSEALPLYQMIAKNVGIRRARGRFVLATNIDIIFSDELVKFLADEKLRPGLMYRIDRIDVMQDVPVDGTVEEQVEYCRTHIIRICAREGMYELTPEGLRKLLPDDIAAQDSGIHFGDGWHTIERYTPEEKFRWVENDGQVIVDVPSEPPLPLILELEPGPGVGYQPFLLQVLDAANQVVAESFVTQRQKLEIQLPHGSPRIEFRLHVPGGGGTKPDDPRILNFRVFSCRWGVAVVDTPAADENLLADDRSGQGEYRLTAQPAELSSLRRALRFYRDAGGPVGAVRAAMLYRSRSKRFTRRAPLASDVFDSAHGVSAGAGWYELEHFRGETFRWAKGNESELIVSAPDGSTRLGLQLEPGPSVGSAAFELLVRDEAGEIVARTVIERLRYTEITLPCTPGHTQVFTLVANGGGRPCPNGDPRILNFRVFWCGWAGTSQPPPGATSGALQAAIGQGFRWGLGWSAPQVAASGQSYRDGQSGAELLANPSSEQATGVFLEVEPVQDGAVFTLEFRDHAGRTVSSVPIDGHQRLHIPLPLKVDRTTVLRLCVAGDQHLGERFRIFQCAWSTAPPVSRASADSAAMSRRAPSEGNNPDAAAGVARKTGSNAAYLHINACGDFTMLARENWFDLRGYPEFDLFSFNIDQLFCYVAHHAGFHEEMLRAPMFCYHIEHGRGSGWTPEGEKLLFDRIRARGLSWVEYPEVVRMIEQMRRLNSPMIFNLQNWGMADIELPETVVGRLDRVESTS